MRGDALWLIEIHKGYNGECDRGIYMILESNIWIWMWDISAYNVMLIIIENKINY